MVTQHSRLSWKKKSFIMDVRDVQDASKPLSDKNNDKTFLIGDRRVPSLVDSAQINAHLHLLSAFSQAKNKVLSREMAGNDFLPPYNDKPPSYSESENNAGSSKRPCSADADTNKLWCIFLYKALYRFELYVQNIITSGNTGTGLEQQGFHLDIPPLLNLDDIQKYKTRPIYLKPVLLPPLDVLMIWHAYLLNPSRYMEDLFYMDSRKNLVNIQFPLSEVASRLDPISLTYVAPEATQFWETQTGEPFNLFDQNYQSCPIQCHHCGEHNFVSWSEIVASDWSFKCSECSMVTDRNRLLGRRWLDAARKWSHEKTHDTSFRLPGAGISAVTGCFYLSDPYSPVLARLFSSDRKGTGFILNEEGEVKVSRDVDHFGIIRHFHLSPQAVYESSSHNIEEIAKKLRNLTLQSVNDSNLWGSFAIANLVRRVFLMMSFYFEQNSISPASLDLVAAVQRQFRFIENIGKLGWLFGDAAAYHTDKISRYHAWLNLVAKHTRMLCPTLDIDLVWHTHQLSQSYYTDCFATVLRFLDHNDKVEKSYLRNAFNDTISLWNQEYQQPYSLCSVHNPATKSPTEFFSRLKAKMKFKSDAIPESYEMNHPTKPSTHNCVIRPGSKKKRKDAFE